MSGNLVPVKGRNREELFRWQKNPIGNGCYGNVDLSLHLVTAAPVRPIRDVTCITGHVSIKMNELNGSQSTHWNVESSEVVVFGPKTNR